ncbi:hypothetical protein BH09DEP1_BH09DEP1_0990 [soil metagenome]
MKSHSYNTATRAKHYAVRRWIIHSCMLSAACLIIMSILYIPEYILRQELAIQHTQLQANALRKPSSAADASNIQLALSKIESRQKKAGQPVALLKKIKTLCHDDSTLESLSLKRHDLQITLAAKNAPTLVTIADSLAQQPACTGLHISSLEPKEQRMIAVLKSHQEIKNS